MHFDERLLNYHLCRTRSFNYRNESQKDIPSDFGIKTWWKSIHVHARDLFKPEYKSCPNKQLTILRRFQEREFGKLNGLKTQIRPD